MLGGSSYFSPPNFIHYDIIRGMNLKNNDDQTKFIKFVKDQKIRMIVSDKNLKQYSLINSDLLDTSKVVERILPFGTRNPFNQRKVKSYYYLLKEEDLSLP